MTFVIATRGSPLALWQADRVAARLREASPGLDVSILRIRTEGDRSQADPNAPFSTTGVFTKEVDAAVLDGRAQAAVHSLKDQPTTLPDGVVLGMVLPRGPVEDVLLGRGGPRFADLPAGARVATGSLRRRAQVLRLRPDLVAVPIRGNVETRIRKLDEGEADALVMARAGIERLGFGSRIAQVFSVEELVPAVSQGIVGVTCREADAATRALLAGAGDATTLVAARAERAFLRRIGGGCNVPAGALATPAGDRVALVARVLDRDGRRVLEDRVEGRALEAETLGAALAATLLARGAGPLIAECRA